jgi:hypothetical protein
MRSIPFAPWEVAYSHLKHVAATLEEAANDTALPASERERGLLHRLAARTRDAAKKQLMDARDPR